MALIDEQQISSELNKLTKEKLIQIIVYKKIPEGCTVSEILRNFVENHKSNTEVFHDGNDHLSCDKIRCINTFADLRVARVEVEAAKMIIQEKERSVENLTTIINIFKNSSHKEVMSECKQPKQPESVTTGSTGAVYAPVRSSAAIPHTGPRSPTLTTAQQNRQRNSEIDRSRQYSNAKRAAHVTPVDHSRSKTSQEPKTTSISNEAVKSAIENATNNHGDDNKPFTTVSYRKRRPKNNTIVGSNSESEISLKQPLKLAFLHVYKLHPETTVNDLQNFLKPIFPEVAVEQLISKYPNYYSSFKVTVSESKLAAAMTPTLWPSGACVNRFFHPRAIKRNST